ncbi:hypothetical protein HPO96_29075 [Kribbella sandramycini]|uniref:Uncharacterized protein n=1 Tax=Kribbella sandramycini TaxID=60450 RepID=A0A7Y4L4Q9_9ACTN|nr:hypothetical protein [Kribbella sandramycini]MBB6571664.1 hypothetical protein [Kribbella sandramycini]NOL44309.1 hypothetical protein [Kribbella sandramycini]
MTEDLKALMERESDRSDRYFAPDPVAILTAGRRRARIRTATVTLTVVAALAVLTSGVGLALREREAPVAGQPRPPQEAWLQCDSSSGRRMGKDTWTWPVVVEQHDAYGAASIRKDPNSHVVVYCLSQPDRGTAQLPLGHVGGIVLRKTAVGDGSKQSVTTVYGVLPTRDGAVDVAVDGKWRTEQASVRDGLFVYRKLESLPWPGPTPSGAVIMLPDGRQALRITHS